MPGKHPGVPSADAEGQGRCTEQGGLQTSLDRFPHQLGFSWDAKSHQDLLLL